MSVPALPAWDVENSGSDGKSEHVQQPSDFTSVALGRKNRLVFQQIVGVEICLPPFSPSDQKKTGSR